MSENEKSQGQNCPGCIEAKAEISSLRRLNEELFKKLKASRKGQATTPGAYALQTATGPDDQAPVLHGTYGFPTGSSGIGQSVSSTCTGEQSRTRDGVDLSVNHSSQPHGLDTGYEEGQSVAQASQPPGDSVGSPLPHTSASGGPIGTSDEEGTIVPHAQTPSGESIGTEDNVGTPVPEVSRSLERRGHDITHVASIKADPESDNVKPKVKNDDSLPHQEVYSTSESEDRRNLDARSDDDAEEREFEEVTLGMPEHIETECPLPFSGDITPIPELKSKELFGCNISRSSGSERENSPAPQIPSSRADTINDDPSPGTQRRRSVEMQSTSVQTTLFAPCTDISPVVQRGIDTGPPAVIQGFVQAVQEEGEHEEVPEDVDLNQVGHFTEYFSIWNVIDRRI